jgi:hypothetical protein
MPEFVAPVRYYSTELDFVSDIFVSALHFDKIWDNERISSGIPVRETSAKKHSCLYQPSALDLFKSARTLTK